MEGDETALDRLALTEIFARLAERGRRVRAQQLSAEKSDVDKADRESSPTGDSIPSQNAQPAEQKAPHVADTA